LAAPAGFRLAHRLARQLISTGRSSLHPGAAGCSAPIGDWAARAGGVQLQVLTPARLGMPAARSQLGSCRALCRREADRGSHVCGL